MLQGWRAGPPGHCRVGGGRAGAQTVEMPEGLLGEFLKRGQWFPKSSRGGYKKPWCLGNALPLY
jgi:hypothetical protein